MKSKLFRLVAAAVGLVLALLGLAAPAMSAPPDDSLIDSTKSVSLTINKHQGPTVGKEVTVGGVKYDCSADGMVLPSQCIDLANNPAVKGAKFAVYRVVGVDLTTNDGWEKAKDYFNAGTNVSDADLADTTKFVKINSSADDGYWETGNNGKVVIDNTALKGAGDTGVGFYYVKEIVGSDGTFTGTINAGTADEATATFTGSVPFYVTLPMTNTRGSTARAEWIYNVNVYPKNDKVEIPHKAVYDDGSMTPEIRDKNGNVIEPGSVINYRVSALIPNYGDVVGEPDGDGKYTNPDGFYDRHDLQFFYITDKFAKELRPADSPVVSVKVIKATVDPTKKTFDNADVIATINANLYTVTTTNETDHTTTVKVEFTKTENGGLDKLTQLVTANPGARVVVEFATTLKDLPSDTGDNPGLIKNTGLVFPGPKPEVGQQPNQPSSKPTNEVKSKYGKIQILKLAVTKKDGTTAPLKDVEFSVYKAKKTGTPGGSWTYTCDVTDIKSQTALTTIKTGSDGYGVTEASLQLSNWYNDGVEQSATGNNNGYLDGAQYAEKYGENQYCLVETKSAPGYQLLAEPYGPIRLTEPGVTKPVDLNTLPTIKNMPDNLENKLPLTGAQGVVALSVVGLLLIGGGTAYYVAYSRKRRA